MVRHSTAALLYKKRTLVSRTASDDHDGVTLNWTVPDNWSCLLFAHESGSNLAYCDRRVRVWKTAGEKYKSECLRIVDRNRIVSVMVNGDNYVRTLSENLLDPVENIFGEINHPFVFQHDNAPDHTAHRTVAWLEQQGTSTIQWPPQSPNLNSLAPGRSECDSKNVIFNLVLLIGIFRSSHDNAVWWIPQDLTDDKSILVQVMAWCRQASSHYLSQCWPRSLSPYASLGHNELIWENKFGILWTERSLESCLSREMIWFEFCTISGWTSRCHICTILTTPFPEEQGMS